MQSPIRQSDWENYALMCYEFSLTTCKSLWRSRHPNSNTFETKRKLYKEIGLRKVQTQAEPGEDKKSQ